MKVYLVIYYYDCCCDNNPEVCGVFSTQELAEAYMNKQEETTRGWFSIEEHILDSN